MPKLLRQANSRSWQRRPKTTGLLLARPDALSEINVKRFVFSNPKLNSLRDKPRASLDALIRVYDEAGRMIETHEHKGDFKDW